MITATLLINKDKQIIKATIAGHAQSNVKGKDLVCAAVSAIVIGTVNALTSEVETSIKEVVKDGYVEIETILPNPIQQHMLLTMSYQLETLSIAQSKYLRFIKQEV